MIFVICNCNRITIHYYTLLKYAICAVIFKGQIKNFADFAVATNYSSLKKYSALRKQCIHFDGQQK